MIGSDDVARWRILVSKRRGDFLGLGRNEAQFPAAPANIGVLPVPAQSRKDLSVVVSDVSEARYQARQ